MSEDAGTLGWGHINVNVTDLDRAVAFYGKLGFDMFIPAIPYLGLSAATPAVLSDAAAEALGVPAGTRGRACILQLGDGFPKLDLTELDASEPRPPLDNADLGAVRLCLASTDLEADYRRLSASGVEFLSAPRPGRDGLADLAVCRDPDGTLIELIRIYPERWAALSR